MKRILLFASACAALAACNVNDLNVNNPKDALDFEKGQRVTLTVNAGDYTKVTSELNSSDGIDFKWETGDVIKVTVGGSSAAFTVSKLIEGGKSAEFTGTMPASGSTFDAQFPYDTPNLSTQDYVANGLAHNKMLASATGCTVCAPFTLAPQYAALRLNFYGLDREITKIMVTNTTAEPNVTYTLNCNPAVGVGLTEDKAGPFFVVVPSGTYSFLVEIEANILNVSTRPDYETYGKGVDVTVKYFSTVSAKEFSKGVINNMPARCITKIWAPVNCGYDASHKYGLMYQWGRAIGQGYDAETFAPAEIVSGQTSNPEDTKFYGNNDDWYSGTEMTAWPHSASNAGYVLGKIANPCPAGWRVPTYDETNRLLAGHETAFGAVTATDYIEKDGMKGHWFNGSKTLDKKKAGSDTEYEGVFIPAAGARFTYYQQKDVYVGKAYFRGEGGEYQGYYWSSSHNTTGIAYGFGFYSNEGREAFNMKAMGYSVRCVVDENAVKTGSSLPNDMTNTTGSWN